MTQTESEKFYRQLLAMGSEQKEKELEKLRALEAKIRGERRPATKKEYSLLKVLERIDGQTLRDALAAKAARMPLRERGLQFRKIPKYRPK